MKLIITDIKNPKFNISGEHKIISPENEVKPCIGCFSCWVKTPGRCAIHDGYENTGIDMSKFLEWLNDSKPDISNKHVYAITNCGFYEGIQAKCAINIVHYWCDKTGNIYGGSVGVGGGEAFDALKSVPVGYGPKASIDKALENLSNAVLNQTTTDDRFENLNYPRFLYKMGATGRWKKLIRKNGGKVKDLGRKLS